MKKNTKQWIVVICFGILCLSSLSSATGAHFTIPGDVDRLCYYTNFFYNYPTEDFPAYFNDLLLFSEKPEGTVSKGGIRDRVSSVIRWHSAIINYMKERNCTVKTGIRFNLANNTELDSANRFMALMGRTIKKIQANTYKLERLYPGSEELLDYFQYSLLKEETLVEQMNKTQYLTYYPVESGIPLPAGLDMTFFREVTGLPMDQDKFFELLVKNESLSLLMGTIYRLSSLEINYVSKLGKEKGMGEYGAWKRIYSNKKFLIGMFFLSNAFRVKEDGSNLLLPGGEVGENLWSQLAGDKIKTSSWDFLERLVTKDDGKLNYLYVFSYYLPEETRNALFFNYNPGKVMEFYSRIKLSEKEKLSITDIPVIGDWSFFMAMYTLKTKDGEIVLPHGIETWLNIINPSSAIQSNKKSGQNRDLLLELLNILADQSASGSNPKEVSTNRKFMAIYTKFFDRSEYFSPEIYRTLYENYDDYNAVVDFIEKIPLKKQDTVLKMIVLSRQLTGYDNKDEEFYTRIYQALFELLSFTANYAPDRFDYDACVTELCDIPMDNKYEFYQGLFNFFRTRLEIGKRFPTLADVLISGITDRTFGMGGVTYEYSLHEMFENTIKEILQSQEVCSFESLLKFNKGLEQGLIVKPPNTTKVGSELNEVYLEFPVPGISDDAPKSVRNRINTYSQDKFESSVKEFIKKVHLGTPKEELEKLKKGIEENYLIYHLGDHLMALAYAVNAKDAKLKSFLNPNFVRLHDIRGLNGRSLWDNFNFRAVRPRIPENDMSEFYLKGPLSRLNITFATRWQEHLFRGLSQHNPAHIQGLINNILRLYPTVKVEHIITYNALLIESAMEILRMAKESTDEKLKSDIRLIFQTTLSGYHYRTAMDYLEGVTEELNLYFNEYNQIGKKIFLSSLFVGREYPQPVTFIPQLEPYKKEPLATDLSRESIILGNIYPNTFGNLTPKDIPLFPQEMGNYLSSGWLSGDMINEYKMKLSYHLYKKQLNPGFLGQFIFMYLKNTAKNFLRQNHQNDYSTSYFIFDIFNNSHLNGLVKLLKKEGNLKLK